MKINHKDLVRKLSKPGGDILKTLTHSTMHILHMAIGISGEVAELLNSVVNDDRKNCIEELGDIEFYFEGLCQGTDIILLHEIIDPAVLTEDPITDVLIRAGDVLDIAKKLAVYNDPSKASDLIIAMQKFRTAIDKFYALTEIPHIEVLDWNIKKLSKRYENLSYSDQCAKDRADKDE